MHVFIASMYGLTAACLFGVACWIFYQDWKDHR